MARSISRRCALLAGALTAYGAGAVAAACNEDGTIVLSAQAPDATMPFDTGAPEVPPAVYDGESVPLASVPRLYIVHASPDAPPLRFCLGLGAPREGGTFFVAGGRPATPTVLPGMGAPFDVQGLDLDTALAVFALDATNPAVVASTGADGGTLVPCEGLVGSDGLGATTDAGGVLRPGKHYWYVGMLPMASPGQVTTRLVSVTGDVDAGTLQLVTWALDTTTAVEAGALGAQVAQASSEWEAYRRSIEGGVTVAGFVVPGDAASDGATTQMVPVAVDAGFGALSPATLASIQAIALDGSAAFGAAIVGPAGAAMPATSFAWPLPAVQALTWPAGPPEGGALTPGAGFVFVLLGDPNASSPYVDPVDGGPSAPDAGGVFNGHYPHFLVFPVTNGR